MLKITLPENVNSERKEITPTYNRAGTLEKVSYDGTEYVENIAYNAKGQRLLIAFGNSIMTRYVYDNRTFRLLRQRSERFDKTQVGNTITYIPESGTNKQDDSFNFDLVGNILKILHRVNDCGIAGSALGSNALDRHFEYDPLYRMISANGRESDTQHENDYLYSDAPAPGTPNASNVRFYTRKYIFDKAGNIQQVKQLGVNGFTRNFTYNSARNTLQKVETPAPSLIEDFTYDACGNQITAGTTRNYVWNENNQLITYYNKAGGADPTIFAQYDYSGMNRVSKLVRTGTSVNPIYERTIYIDGIFEYHILENGSTFEKNHIHVMDSQSRIAMIRVGMAFPDDIANAVTYNLEDQVSSSVARLDVNGSIIDKEEYYPFGDSSLRTFSKKRYRFSGKEKDAESGLYYYGARYYQPWTCRFISVDPLMEEFPDISPYVAFDNNPILYEDPLGLAPKPPRRWLSWLSTALDFVPIVGQIKAGIEAVTGYNMDGTKLSATERGFALLSLIPGGVLISKTGKLISKALNLTKAVSKSKILQKVNKVVKKVTGRIPFKNQLTKNDIQGLKGEKTIKKKLLSKLTNNQLLLEKPYMKSNVTNKGSYPDFVIYDKVEHRIDDIIEVKTGNSPLSKGQEALRNEGGTLLSKKVDPKVVNVPTEVEPNILKEVRLAGEAPVNPNDVIELSVLTGTVKNAGGSSTNTNIGEPYRKNDGYMYQKYEHTNANKTYIRERRIHNSRN